MPLKFYKIITIPLSSRFPSIPFLFHILPSFSHLLPSFSRSEVERVCNGGGGGEYSVHTASRIGAVGVGRSGRVVPAIPRRGSGVPAHAEPHFQSREPHRRGQEPHLAASFPSLSLPSFPSLSPPLRSNYFASRSGRVQISHQSRPAKPWGVPRRRWRAAAAAAAAVRCRGICGLGIEPVRLTVAESADRRLP